MFSGFGKKIQGAIDRSIAEEQARQKANVERSNANSPSGSTPRPRSVSRTNSSNSPAKRRIKKPSQDAINGDTAVNPDPAVFEAAFVIDDDEADNASQTSPEKSTPPEPGMAKEQGNGDTDKQDTGGEHNGEKKEDGTSVPEGKAKDPVPPAPAELSPQLKTRLKKLEKLEATYPELLRSYRIAHGRATSIEPFERALRENTPLTTIKDPAALVEYLNQLNLKGDMVMDEFKRVSAEKDSFKKKYEDADKELSALKDEMAQLKSAKTDTGDKTGAAMEEQKAPDEAKRPASPSASKSPDVGEDMFSYDDEIPQLQAEVASKTEEIARLNSEVGILKEELSVAKENSAGLVESLEKATRELSESRDKVAVQESVQTQLDARNTEITSLTERLEKTQSQLREVESSLRKEMSSGEAAVKEHISRLQSSTAKNTGLDAELKKIAETKSQLENKVEDLSTEIDQLRKSKKESEEKVEQLNKKLESTSQTVAGQSESLTVPAQPSAAGGVRSGR
ncbi:hypothetical protein F4778DRAFT_696550 [Xylariomycetidae sp. FL2044]|nr:hypothetical protein F4778DRAFT_696550 [Xylariomycetidae sp. FL2044]